MNRLMSTRGVFASSEGHSGDAQCAGGRMERGGRVEIITRKPAYPSVTESGTVFPAAAIPGRIAPHFMRETANSMRDTPKDLAEWPERLENPRVGIHFE